MAPRSDDGGILGWEVRCAKQGEGNEVVTTEEVFDAIVVAVGQFTQPRIPTINGTVLAIDLMPQGTKF
jgi:cation diffusion facilitator CzcD-associated flavoprotein CzcO